MRYIRKDVTLDELISMELVILEMIAKHKEELAMFTTVNTIGGIINEIISNNQKIT